MRFALIGQPNCGKSTLFNQVAGYKAETGNFSGTTVTFTESKVRVMGQVVQIVDLPGTYTLIGTNPAEREVFLYLSAHDVDVIINVVDATHLALGLELTVELLELGRPLVVALNMVDEARRIGLRINVPELSKRLGVPVLPMIASRGQGVRDVFVTALNTAKAPIHKRLPFSPEVESAIHLVAAKLPEGFSPIASETMALKLLEGDTIFLAELVEKAPGIQRLVETEQQKIKEKRNQPAVYVIGGERHGKAASLAESICSQGERRITWRDRLDDVLLHPVWGYVILIVVLFLFFEFVYTFGTLVEKPLLSGFDILSKLLEGWVGKSNLSSALALGLLQGISGGIAIVLPYLMPFLLGLGLLEDVGYLPRVAFMMDAFMHRIGLHGKAIVPFILGYGCNVPAVMSTRIMEDKRDRYLAAALSTLVPCAARLSVVFGLVAFYLGPVIALLIYLFNLIVIALTAKILSGLLSEDSVGLILEMPVYRIPTTRNVFAKAWFRIREFIFEAWPILIAGSAVMAVMNFFKWSYFLNLLTRPLSWALGLPMQVGVPLVFGILRKELSLVMLRQAMGGVGLGSVLSPVQMVTYAVFVVFYIPCLATLVVLRKELGTKAMFSIAGLTIIVATLAALFARGVGLLFLPG